jgi:hypothetical protein
VLYHLSYTTGPFALFCPSWPWQQSS